MHAVSLEQAAVGGDPIEEEGVERHAVSARGGGVHRLERAAVIAAEVGRCAHARKKHGDAAARQLGEDRIEVRARLRHGQAAQHVVGAQLHDHQRRRAAEPAQPPAQPGMRLRHRIPGDAAVAHRGGDARSAERRLQLLREALRGRQAVARGEAIAERPDQRRRRCGSGGRAGPDEGKKEREVDKQPPPSISHAS